VQELLISNVKADLARQIAALVKMVEIEPTDTLVVEDSAWYGRTAQEARVLLREIGHPKRK